MPVLIDLIKDEKSEVKLNAVSDLIKLAPVLKTELLSTTLINLLQTLIKDSEWRVRMVTMQLIAELGLFYGSEVFKQTTLHKLFMKYLENTAAKVRQTGIEKSSVLAQKFGNEWVMQEYLPPVLETYKTDKRGYNYRMCCLYALQAVMPIMTKEQITEHVLPIFVKACKDEIPNVNFCVCRIIAASRSLIDSNAFNSLLSGKLKELLNDDDKDVVYFANQALQAS